MTTFRLSTAFPEPTPENGFLTDHVELLCGSYHHWLGAHLGNLNWQGERTAGKLYQAPFVLVAHDTAADPVFTYGNLAAQQVFETDWGSLTSLPSRFSAEPVAREARAQFLKTVSSQGYIDDYAGVRVSSTGRRFMIEEAIVWNLRDEHGNYAGQAAMFDRWHYL